METRSISSSEPGVGAATSESPANRLQGLGQIAAR